MTIHSLDFFSDFQRNSLSLFPFFSQTWLASLRPSQQSAASPAPPIIEAQAVAGDDPGNAPAGAGPNDEDLNRDWLDWVYAASRAVVLLSLVYFYSSFSRFVMVTGAMLLLYL